MNVGKIVGGLWLALFGILLTFLMGVVVWALAGPTLALIVFALVFVLFVWLPYKARRTTKTPPHPGG